MKTEDSWKSLFGAFGIAVLSIVPMALLSAWCWFRAWQLVAVPLGAPEVNKWLLWGAVILVKFVTRQTQPDDPADAERSAIEKTVRTLATGAIGDLAMWGCAVLAHWLAFS